MVALHAVPVGPSPIAPTVADDDFSIAVGPGAHLAPGAEALAGLPSLDGVDAWYGDIVIDGREILRPAWSPTRLLTEPTAVMPLAVRGRWLRAHAVSTGDPALALRLVETGATVAHVPQVVSHHETFPDGPGLDELDAHLGRVGIPATIDPNQPRRLVPEATFAPEISAVIPTAGATLEIDGTPERAVSRLLESLAPLPDRVEVVIVVGDEFRGDRDRPAGDGPGTDRVRVVNRAPGPFNFASAVNLGILHARHDLVVMLNDDMEADGTSFLDQMAMHLCDPTVAAVGARLLYPSGAIQHAGVVVDDARPLHPFVGWRPEDAAFYGGDVARDVIAVTGGCLMLRRRDHLAVGGLSTGFPLSFNDIDLCIRLRRAVGRVVVEPNATLFHHETLSREPVITAGEWDRWIARWGEIVDPWYHPRHRRPDDPDRLHLNADHLPPVTDPAPLTPAPRDTRLRSVVHRGRASAPTRPIVAS